jgi:hypothetical protein
MLNTFAVWPAESRIDLIVNFVLNSLGTSLHTCFPVTKTIKDVAIKFIINLEKAMSRKLTSRFQPLHTFLAYTFFALMLSRVSVIQ